jgi:hypothetical protein
MIAVATGVLGVVQTWLSNHRSASGHARPAHRGLPPPAAPVARVLHPHAHRRGAVAHRQRHRRRAERRHLDRDVDRLQRDDGVATVVAMVLLDWRLALFSLVLPRSSSADPPVGGCAQAITARAQGDDGRHLDAARRGVAVGLAASCSARRWAAAPSWPTASRASRRTGRPRGALADGRPLADGLDPDDRLRDHARRSSTWFAGLPRHGGGAISIGTLVAFTTLQTRLFFPISSLLDVGVDIQTSLALFDRIFEYLDLPVDIDEPAGPGRCTRACAGEVRFEDVWFRYGGRRVDARAASTSTSRRHDARRSSARPARARRRSATSSRGCTTRRAARHDRRRRRARPDVRRRSPRRRRRLAGDLPVPRLVARTCASPSPTRPTRRSRRRPRRADPRPDRRAARRLRHGRRRARLPLLRRREAAHRDRPHDPAQPAGARARRGDERARHRDRARGAGGARRARRGPHDDRDRPPALDRPRRRPDRRARRRPDRRARHARRAARPRRPLRRPAA